MVLEGGERRHREGWLRAALIVVAGLGVACSRTAPGLVRPRDGVACVEVGLGLGDQTVTFATERELSVVDVLFLLDVTSSMSGELETIARILRETIVPAFAREIPDVAFGVATFADFPIFPYGAGDDRPFVPLLRVTDDVGAAEDALRRQIAISTGQDRPEAQVEALYQVATGEGLGEWIAESSGRAGAGAVGFRPEALPVVGLFTDAPFHGGPAGAASYSGIEPTPHRWQEAVDALDELGAEVIGFDSSTDAEDTKTDLDETAAALGTLGAGGAPLVFEVGEGGERLDVSVVDAVQALVHEVRLDVDATVRDAPGDGLDGADFVASLRPLSAEPPDGVEAIDEAAFRGVVPGSRLTFALSLRNDAIEPGPEPVVIPIEVVLRGNSRTTLGVVEMDIVVPALDGRGCPPP